jgi:hypothetical protein
VIGTVRNECSAASGEVVSDASAAEGYHDPYDDPDDCVTAG